MYKKESMSLAVELHALLILGNFDRKLNKKIIKSESRKRDRTGKAREGARGSV